MPLPPPLPSLSLPVILQTSASTIASNAPSIDVSHGRIRLASKGPPPRSSPLMMAHSSSLAAPTPPILSLSADATRSASASIPSASTHVTREGGVLASNTSRAKAKRKAPTSNQPKHSAAKRPKPTMVTIVRSPGIRIMISPMLRSPITRALSPSPTHERSASSSSEEATTLRHRSSRSRSRHKLTSTVWNDFDPIYEGEVLTGAHCVHCGKNFKGCTRCWELGLVVVIDIYKNLLELIVAHELPFSFMEYPKFRSFMASLNPCFKHVSRNTIKADCISEFQNKKVNLRVVLSGSNSRLSLAADMWTSKQRLGYLCITCHFIDDKWKLKKKIIQFAVVETPHDGKNMLSAMVKALQNWNIEHKLFSIALDNASVNDCFVSSLKQNLLERKLLLSNGDLFHSLCATHILNLIVQDGLSAISGATHKIRESVKYVGASQARKQRFKEMIMQVGLPKMKWPFLDVPHQWNATYDILTSALPYKRAFKALAREEPHYEHLSSNNEWGMAEKICSMLIVFHKATLTVSGSKYSTANLYFHEIWEVKKLLDTEILNSHPTIVSMVYEMIQKFEKYWKLSFLQICNPVILDARFKLSFLEYCLRQEFEITEANEYLKKIDSTIRELFAEYSSKMGSLQESNIMDLTADGNNLCSDGSSPWSDWGQHVNAQKRKRANELDKYLEEEVVSIGADFDILQYWKMFSPKYPILAQMTRDILVVPASTVPSECAFSTGGRVISDYRSNLSSETTQSLICLQSWIRAEDTEIGDSEDDEDDMSN